MIITFKVVGGFGPSKKEKISSMDGLDWIINLNKKNASHFN